MADETSAVDLFVEAGCPRHIAEEYTRDIANDVDRWGSAVARDVWRMTAEDEGDDDWLAAVEAAVSQAAQ